MTPEEIRQVVDALADKQSATMLYYIVLLIVAGVASYLGSYLSTKGKNLATKEDIDELTRTVEKVKTEYAKQLEEFKIQLALRLKAEKVSELFARAFYEKGDAQEFNRLNWELSLYLPKEIVCEISQHLVNGKNPGDAMKILLLVRKHLGIDDGLQWDNIAYTRMEQFEQK